MSHATQLTSELTFGIVAPSVFFLSPCVGFILGAVFVFPTARLRITRTMEVQGREGYFSSWSYQDTEPRVSPCRSPFTARRCVSRTSCIRPPPGARHPAEKAWRSANGQPLSFEPAPLHANLRTLRHVKTSSARQATPHCRACLGQLALFSTWFAFTSTWLAFTPTWVTFYFYPARESFCPALGTKQGALAGRWRTCFLGLRVLQEALRRSPSSLQRPLLAGDIAPLDLHLQPTRTHRPWFRPLLVAAP